MDTPVKARSQGKVGLAPPLLHPVARKRLRKRPRRGNPDQGGALPMATTPAFPPEVFQARRAEVLRRMRELSPGPSVAVFPATPIATRNSDVEHPYRADSDVFFLSGFEEPEAVAVLSTGDKPFTLFVRPRDKEREIWNGRRAGVDGAVKIFGADQAFEITKLGE